MNTIERNSWFDTGIGEDISLDELGSVMRSITNEISLESDLDTNNNWSNLPGCYGTYCGTLQNLNTPTINGEWPLVSSVLDDKNFHSTGYDSLKIIEKIINKPANNKKRYTLHSLNKNKSIILYEISTGTYVDNAVSGILYTMEVLKTGAPVIFGVNCQPYAIPSEDESTNSYVIIVGMGNDGRNYFLGWDTACLLFTGDHSQKNSQEGICPTNKIYLDPNWPGLLRADNSWANEYANARQPYKVTRILRTFQLQQ